MIKNLFLQFVNRLKDGELDSNGKKHGSWIERHENGSVAMQGHFNHGEKHGEFSYYRNDGTLSGRQTFEMGYPLGIDEVCNNQGEVYRRTVHFRDSEKILRSNGVEYFDSRNGVIAEKWATVGGLMDGTYEKYFPNGNTKLLGQYETGTEIGEWIYYREDKSIEKKRHYVDGWREYFEEIFDVNENIVETIFYLKDQVINRQ